MAGNRLLRAHVAAGQDSFEETLAGYMEYDDGTAAYLTQSASLNGLVSLSLNATLAPIAGQDEGAARIIVTVTDQTGQVGADTVNITITTTNE